MSDWVGGRWIDTEEEIGILRGLLAEALDDYDREIAGGNLRPAYPLFLMDRIRGVLDRQ